MKVLFISNDPAIFNTESPVRARMRSYAKAIGALHILSLAPKGTPRMFHEELEGGGELYLYAEKSHKFLKLQTFPARAKAIVRDQGIEIVSAQDPFENGLAALKAVAGTSVKLHLQIHTDIFSPWFIRGKDRAALLNRFRLTLSDKVLPNAHGIRVVSERIRDSLVARYGDKIPVPQVIPIAVSRTLPLSSPLPPGSLPFSLISVSRFEAEKRIGDILQALALVKDRYPSVGLLLVGDGRCRTALQKQTERLGLSKRVQFLGWRTDAGGLMQNAQAYIQASAYEGYGQTLIEAALAGIPIITTDVGIVGEVLRPEQALISPPGDPTSLAVHIAALVEDNRARMVLTQEARKRVEEHLAHTHSSPEDIAADLARVLAL